jgi:hypothetical protein
MYVLFLAGNVSALANFFPDQERKIPGNPEIPEVFPGLPGFPAGDGDYSLTFVTVYFCTLNKLCCFSALWNLTGSQMCAIGTTYANER